MPGDIRSFFGGGGAKKPASPKPPAALEAKAEPKADVAMVDLTDDLPAPASVNKRKAQDVVDVRATLVSAHHSPSRLSLIHI